VNSGFQVGLGYRRELHDALMAAPAEGIDFLELAPENYLGLGGDWRRRLDAVGARWPLITHGLAMSLAGPDPLDDAYVDAVADFVQQVGSPWHSDHLCVGLAHGRHTHELLPAEMSRAGARRVAGRVRDLASSLPVPMAVENISAYGRWPSDELSEADYVTQIVETAGCGLLLDVNNILVNAINFGEDEFEILARMPAEAAVQIHVAGFERRAPDLVIDTHSTPVHERVWPLLAAALERTGPVPVLLERDNDIPPLGELQAELDAIRAIGAQVFGAGS
jgi:uncharacterized protein (UPF0276 family)